MFFYIVQVFFEVFVSLLIYNGLVVLELKYG